MTKNPFMHKNSMVHKVFSMALSGTTFSKIRAYVNKNGGSVARLIRILRKESYNGYTWKLHEEEQKIQIENVQATRTKKTTGRNGSHGTSARTKKRKEISSPISSRK